MTMPAIKITSSDYDRLDTLLARPQYRHLPAAEALRQEMERAEVVEPAQMPAGVITMHSTARCLEEGEGREYELTLVYPTEADGSAGRVSVLAPVGTAMLGLATGQEIDWPGPGGQVLRLRVLAVTYQPEAAGDFNR
ncbi:nucleoside diphosphate kinase regulator [Sulfurivermis fontis]|uniref:nucleoside diphosphate kinase regulator n=1 Tax=Sulfurivermis fontis TaxID=1972068 RepID=UPI000FDCA9EF|nr:nucleoside diphosphate kinase regulator [Sulfurivermis fontis]